MKKQLEALLERIKANPQVTPQDVARIQETAFESHRSRQ